MLSLMLPIDLGLSTTTGLDSHQCEWFNIVATLVYVSNDLK